MDYEYIFRKMCERRGVVYDRSDSVGFNTAIAFGYAGGGPLPAVAGKFYFIPSLFIFPVGITGQAQLNILPNSGLGSAGTPVIRFQSTDGGFSLSNIECDSMIYAVQSHSAGTFYLMGACYSISYTE